MLISTDTIVAVSSPPGRSPRGLIRISGPSTADILNHLVVPQELPVREFCPATLELSPHSSDLATRYGNDRGYRGNLLPVLAMRFIAPRSYTGQDMAEIQAPGHPILLERLLHLFIDHGARMAQPGEFTFRAVIAGKLDLTQAEGIAATIAAVNDGQLRAANLLRQGELGRLTRQMVDQLSEALALVEAGIDFTDQDDIHPIAAHQLAAALATLRQSLTRLLSQSRSWAGLQALPRVVLVGPPSSGKSTLFNALLGHARSLISPQPGTTRDVILEPLTLYDSANRPVEIMLVDLAGLDDPATAVDRQAQMAALQAIRQADLVLSIRDPDQRPSGIPPTNASTLAVLAKVDLVSSSQKIPDGVIAVSAWKMQGLDALRTAILERLGQHAITQSGQMLALQPRHHQALLQTLDLLEKAQHLLGFQEDSPDAPHSNRRIDQPELLAQLLRLALDELSNLTGRMTPDDVLGKIFATFCVGK